MVDHEGRPQGLTEREAEVYRLTVVNMMTQQAIADRLGLSFQRISQILAEARRKMPPPDLAKIRDAALALHEDVIRRAYEIAEMKAAPVFVGKDGNVARDPEDDSVVRDHAAQMNALKLALAADAERRKLMGADAASKAEVAATVRYELVGVDPEDLT